MSTDDFASRWSDRKRKVAEETKSDEVLTSDTVVEENPVSEKTDAEILEELGLKDPETMEIGDDFSGFMNSAIPTRIRNRALRKLWASNPAFGVVDGLVEYGEDYTDAATVVENLQTAYQVGKGILRKMTEIESDEDISDDDDVSEDAEASQAQITQEIIENSSVEADQSETDFAAASEVAEEEVALEFIDTAKNNRRMRFQFDGDT